MSQQKVISKDAIALIAAQTLAAEEEAWYRHLPPANASQNLQPMIFEGAHAKLHSSSPLADEEEAWIL